MSIRKLTPAIAAGLLLMLCFAFSITNAQETQNGMETRTPRKMSDRMVGASLMGPVPTGGPWIEFAFFGKGSSATGCSPADPAGPGCAPSSAGNSVFGSAPPWTFTAPAGGANLTVTDAFLRGDQFEIFDFGTSIGTLRGRCRSQPRRLSHGRRSSLDYDQSESESLWCGSGLLSDRCRAGQSGPLALL